MRRLLASVTGYHARLSRDAVRGWVRFFFTPGDPTTLGLIRLLIGCLLVWNMSVLGLDLRAFLGTSGWAEPGAVGHFLAEREPWAWSLWTWVPDAWLVTAWAGCLVVLILFAVGYRSSLTAALAWVITVSVNRRVPVILYGFDQIVSTVLFYLAASGASGQAVSLDRFLARWRAVPIGGRGGAVSSGVPTPTVSANLALRMIQLHLCLIYGLAGLSKLSSPEWWNGSALEMILITPEFRRFDLAWALRYTYLLNLATHAGLLVEILFPVLVWVRPLRPLVLAAVVLLHIGIDLALGLTEFAIVMVAANLSFVAGDWLRSLVTGGGRTPVRLLYDGRRPGVRRIARLIGAADPDRQVELVDEPTPEGFRLCDQEGRDRSGASAVVEAARRTPLLRLPALAASIWLRSFQTLHEHTRRNRVSTPEFAGNDPGPAHSKTISSR
ncbi:MAG: hypothetical protein NVSMB9_35900 [Isosphaeraceae bacterium]